MNKDQMLEHWRALKPGQTLPVRPVPYKREGSTYDQDGIRITGSTAFIVLSRLKDMLEFECSITRLHVNYQQSKDRQTQMPLDSYNCYIQVHQRGHEGAMVQAFMMGRGGAETEVAKLNRIFKHIPGFTENSNGNETETRPVDRKTGKGKATVESVPSGGTQDAPRHSRVVRGVGVARSRRVA